MKKETELALKWLQKARNDIITAKQTLLLKDAPTDTICFHCQQAIEKSIKALLTHYNIEFPKTHDLILLLNLSYQVSDILKKYKDNLAEMKYFAIEMRYPDDYFEPIREEAEKALVLAIEIRDLISSIISESQLF